MAAEILRDNPDLPADPRARFHAAVIADGERLNRLVDACFGLAGIDDEAPRPRPLVAANDIRDD